MSKNEYNLCNEEERKELFYEYLFERLRNVSFSEFEEAINFLCNKRLSNEWLTVYRITIGNIVCNNKLTSDTNQVYSVDIYDLLDLGKCLKVFDNEKIRYYINKLNTKSFNRISVVSEIRVTSKYIMNGYQIKIEPENKRIGKSGLEGKSDIGVKFNQEWIYFEITQENFFLELDDSKIEKLLDIATIIGEAIKKQSLLPSWMRVTATIENMNRVLSTRWSHKFLDQLKRSSIKVNMQKNFDGIIYKVENKQFNDMIFSFNTPLKDIKKNINKKIKRESKQIPENQSGVIIINSWLNFGNYIIYSRELLKQNMFNNILAIIIWNKDKHAIITRENLTKEFLDFLRIPFK